MSLKFRNKILDKSYEEVKDIIISEYPMSSLEFMQKYHFGKAFLKNLSGGKTWNEIIIDCGLEPTMIRPGNYTRKDIINSVLDFYNYSIESNIKFSSCNYRKFGRYSQTVIDKNFNNWGELLKECGLYEKLYNYKDLYETVSGNSNIIRTSKKDKNGNIVHLSIEMVTEIVKNNISDSIIDFNKLDSEYGLTRHILTKAFGGLNNFYKVFNVSVKKIKSTGENSISSILNSMNIGYVKEFHGPKNPFTGNLLSYDFLIPSMNIIIEVHGKHHYEYEEYFHKSIDNFENRSIIDNLKIDWAYSNGYKLFIIPYSLCTESYLLKLISNIT